MKKSHRKKMNLMRKPNWIAEFVIVLAACACVTFVPAAILYANEKRAVNSSIRSAIEDEFHYQARWIMQTSGEADWYINASDRVRAGLNVGEELFFQSGVLGGWNSYDTYIPVNTAYRIIGTDPDAYEDAVFGSEMGDDVAVLTLQDPDTYMEHYYECRDKRVVDALRAVVSKTGEMNDRYGVLRPWIDELGLDLLYIEGNTFMLDANATYGGIKIFGGEQYDIGSGYTRCDVITQYEQGMVRRTYVNVGGCDYELSAIDVSSNSIWEKLTDEQSVLDTLAKSVVYEKWQDRIDQSFWYTIDNTYTWVNSYDDGGRVGNDRCGRHEAAYRDYAGMLGRLTAPDGARYWLLGTVSYDVHQVWKEIAEVIYGIWGISCLLLSVVLTIIIYLTRKNRYDRQEYRRNMTNAMAHDLKTPLMAMSGYAENLLANVHTDKRQQYAEAISENVRKMNGMIEQMLELDRIEGTGKKTKNGPDPIDMAELFRKAITENEVSIQRKHMEVTVSGNCTFAADAEEMKRVVDNLVTSAIRYGRENGTIDVELVDGSIRISNETNEEPGCDIESLWKPYVRGSDSRAGGGSGLGLFVVKTVLDKYGLKGRLEYDQGIFSVIIVNK